MSTELVERLRARAEDERSFQRNNETVAAALAPQLEAFERRDGSHNTFALRLMLDHRSCAKHDAELAADWDEAADELTALTADRDAARKVYLTLQQSAASLAAKNTALTATVALLTEALRPFASEAARYGAYGDGSQRAWLNCTVADLRAARRALSEPDKNET